MKVKSNTFRVDRVLLATVLILLLFTTPVTAAQDMSGWPVEERCLGDLPYPTVPQNQWSFEGVIFSKNEDGIRAIRADVGTSYFVALDSEDSFAFDGSFSPDGRWFAFPRGSTSYNNMVSNFIGVGEIEVVSTDPRQETYVIPWQTTSFSGVTRGLPTIYWLDNDRFLYDGSYEQEERFFGGGIIHPFTGEILSWENETPLYTLFLFSPDSTRAFYWDRYDNQIVKLYDVDRDTFLVDIESLNHPIIWLPDSAAFVMQTPANPDVNPADSTLTLFSRDGQPTDIISTLGSFGSATASRDSHNLAFTAGNYLFTADLENHSVTDLCFEMKTYSFDSGMAWSPDNTHLVFTYDGYPIILNTESLDMQILRYETDEILGWYALEE